MERRESQRAGFRRGFDNECHVWRVFDVEVEGGPVASRPLEDAKDGQHYATFASSASATVSVRDGSNAARMTAEVCWMTSKLSASKEALPWYRWM